MTTTHRSHLAAFLFGAILAVEITGLALGNGAVAFGAMLAGALLGFAATFWFGIDHIRKYGTKENPR